MYLAFRFLHKRFVFLTTLVFFFFWQQPAAGQCSMCRAVLESEGNNAVAEGVNNGIVYLMAIPYILIAVLFYFVAKSRKGDNEPKILD